MKKKITCLCTREELCRQSSTIGIGRIDEKLQTLFSSLASDRVATDDLAIGRPERGIAFPDCIFSPRILRFVPVSCPSFEIHGKSFHPTTLMGLSAQGGFIFFCFFFLKKSELSGVKLDEPIKILFQIFKSPEIRSKIRSSLGYF